MPSEGLLFAPLGIVHYLHLFPEGKKVVHISIHSLLFFSLTNTLYNLPSIPERGDEEKGRGWFNTPPKSKKKSRY